MEDYEAHLTTAFPEASAPEMSLNRRRCISTTTSSQEHGFRPAETPLMRALAPRGQVRLKRFLEMRGADCGSQTMICALPALWVRSTASACPAAAPGHGCPGHTPPWRCRPARQVGLLYDAESLAQASSLVSDWSTAERAYLRAEVRHTPARRSAPWPSTLV